jgi:ABC-type polysaccharide/polyol phosphate export permease
MQYITIFFTLLKKDLLIFKKNLFKGMVNTIIWVGALSIVYAYVYPQLGMTKKFGAIFITGAVVTCCIFEMWKATANFISDLKNNQVLLYPFTLPIPAWLYLTQIACSYAIRSMTSGIIIIPLGKFIIWNEITLNTIAPLKFLLMFVCINVFCGFLSLFISSITKDIETMRKVWMRILFPLWFLGGARFTWNVSYKLWPPFAYATLLNPVTYTMEGIRACTLESKDFISFWLSFCMIIVFTGILGFVGFKNLKCKLDFV